MKRVYFLQFTKDCVPFWYLVCNGRNYSVTTSPAKATLFDTYERACKAKKFMPDFSIKFVDVCLK